MDSIANMSEMTNGTKGMPGRKRGIVDVITSNTRCIWDRKVEGTEMDKFKAVINKKYQLKLESYWELHEWSVKNYESFWEEIWNYYEVIHSKPYQEIAKNGKGFVDVDWFRGARLNFAENMLRIRDGTIAIIGVDDEGNEEQVTYAEMYQEVKRYAAAFRKNGLKKGDRVACYMSNRKEAVFAYLAVTSVGGIWGGSLPFYAEKGASKIIRRMLPKFLFIVDRFLDLETEKHLMKSIPVIVKDLDCLEKVIICPTTDETLSFNIKELDPRCIFLDKFLESGNNDDGSTPELVFEQLPFNYPICINFTSGTTGQPKGLIHGCGTFLPLLRDLNLHYNLRKGDVILNSYPVGWNLWNLFIGCFSLGSTVVFYNKSLFNPDIGIWEVMNKFNVVFTFLPTVVVDKMEKNDAFPGPGCKLEHLKLLTIGASPVKLQNFDFLLNKVKKDLFVNCSYGATEVIGTFSGFDLNTPVYSAEIQAPALGVDLKCFDEQGNSVIDQRGELVICTPNPSFPVAVWGDNEGRKLEELYLSKYPGVWDQNDECWIDPNTKGIVIIGRSDDVLIPHGGRFGSSDIYYAIHNMEELQDYICIGQDNNQGDQRAVLFVKLKPEYTFSSEFAKKVQQQVLSHLSVEHVPDIVLEAKDIPYNLNGKKLERLLKIMINKNEIPDITNVKNPECLNAFLNIPELQGY